MRAKGRKEMGVHTVHCLLRLLLGASTLGALACSSGGGGDSPGSGGKSSAATGGTGTGGSASPAGTGGGSSTASGGAGIVPGTGGAGPSATGGGSSGGSPSAASSGGAGNPAGGAAASTGGASGGRTATGSGGVTGGGGGTPAAGGGPPIVDLFNGTDLTGWTAYRETAATSPGTMLTPAQAMALFKPEDGTIRVYGDAADQSTQARHTLVSAANYTKYNFWVEYKWGTKKFAPYTNLTQYPRDAGVLFHLHNDKTQVWPSSFEFQIKDGTTGDIFALYAQCTSLGKNGGTTFAEAADGGTMKLVNGNNGFTQHGRSANFEMPDWNTIQLQVNGATAVYIVNGHIVNRVLSAMDKTGKQVTMGPIALQAEHAEVFYRNVRIQVLP